MRPQRPHHLIWPAILTAAVGVVVAPASAHGGTDPIAPADDAVTTSATATAGPTSTSPTTASPEPEPDPGSNEEPEQDTDTTPPDTTPPDTTPPDTTPPGTAPGSGPPEAPPPSSSVPGSGDPEDPEIEEPGIEEPAPGATGAGEDELDRDAFEALPDGIVRPISFPVLGAVNYANGWGACRDGCRRRHVGTDIIGVRMQPVLAAVDGTVTRIRHENVGTAGAVITVTGADGWRYNYFHLNNDTPGTDDGLALPAWQTSPKVSLGSTVRAGQVIAYMGDSGNAEGSVPHLHFEIRQPDGIPINPYPSLIAAQERQTCAPAEARISLITDATGLSADAIAIIPIDGGGRWLIDRDGGLFAEGSAASVPAVSGIDCVAIAPPPPPVLSLAAPVTAPADSPPASSVVAPPAAPAQTATPWTVEPGQSLWLIAQEFYGVSDAGATVPLVDFVYETNRDQLTDPGALEVGMILGMPALRF